MSTLEIVVEELKSLPPARQQQAASFIHRLKKIAATEKQAALDAAFGCMSPEEADQFQHRINEGCERIDA
jgi:hypothetical protein